MAASLTFTTLLSVVPLITIALTLFSAFPVFSEFSTPLKEFILMNMVPETGGRIITGYMEQFAESASRLTAVGIVFLAVTAMLLMLTIDNAFNMIWRVSRPRSLLQRVLVYWAVLTLAPLLVGGSLSLTSWLVGFSSEYAQQVPCGQYGCAQDHPGHTDDGCLHLAVPCRAKSLCADAPCHHRRFDRIGGVRVDEPRVRLLHLALPHLQAGVWRIRQHPDLSDVDLFFLAHSVVRRDHHCLALALAQYAFAAAGSGSKLYYAVGILKLMHKGLSKGEVQTLPVMSRHLRIGYDDVERILEKLVQAKIVGKLAGQGWSMVRTPEAVELSELLKIFLLDVATLPKHTGDGDIKAWFASLEKRVNEPRGMTLQDVWNKIA